jgi:hypothetical protein
MDSKLNARLPGMGEAITEERARTRDAERWAAALTAQIPAQPPVASIPTGDWQPSDSALTQTKAAQAETTSEPLLTSNLRVDIPAGDLGNVGVSINRTPEGLRVTIEVSSANAAKAMEPERIALENALRAQGMTVASVRVSQPGANGTALARRWLKPDGTMSGRQRSEEEKRRIKISG